MATDLDTVPWPGGNVLRETAMSRAKKAEQLAAGFSLARTKEKMTFNGKMTVAEADWMELARLLSKLGVNLDESEVAPVENVTTVVFQEIPGPAAPTPPAPVIGSTPLPMQAPAPLPAMPPPLKPLILRGY